MPVVVGFKWPIAHDNAAAAIVDGRLVFATEEERFTRHKYSQGEPAFYSLLRLFKFLETNYAIKPLDVDAFAFNNNPALFPLYGRLNSVFVSMFFTLKTFNDMDRAELSKTIAKSLLGASNYRETARLFLKIVYRKMGYDLPDTMKIYPVEHHLAHAASAYYFMGHPSAAVLTVDGTGERDSTAVWHVKNGEFEKLWRAETLSASLGLFYEAISQKMGFTFLEGPGKVMGLAPYGKYSKRMYQRLEKFLELSSKGGKLNFKIKDSKKQVGAKSAAEFRHMPGKYVRIAEEVSQGLKLKWEDKSKINKDTADLSWALQNITEKTVCGLAEYAKENTGEQSLGLAGGVALNAKANMEVHYANIFKDIFIFPAAGDAGGPIGAAAYAYEHLLGGKMRNGLLSDAYLGPEYDDAHVKRVVEKGKWESEYIGDDVSIVSDMIAKGKIMTWYQGRAELGPRALGNRSIIADPRKLANWELLNKIKGREWWRPLAPSLLSESAKDYFVNPLYHQFMILMFKLHAEGKKRVPAVCHIDMTARPQMIKRSDNKNWYDLIKGFKELTGEGLVVNTSFNLAGEPLVETPEDAIRSFALGGFDAMYMQGYLIKKR